MKSIIQNRYVKASLHSATIRYVFFGLNFAGLIILMRILEPEHFGLIAIVLAILGVLDVFFAFSTSIGYIYYNDTDTLLASAIALSLLNWIVYFFASLLLYYPIQHYYNNQIANFVVVLAMFKIFYFINQIQLAYLEKHMKFTVSSTIIGLSGFLALVFGIIAAYFGLNEYSLLIRELLIPIVGFLLYYTWRQKKLTYVGYDPKEIVKLFRYSRKTIMSRGSELIYLKFPIAYISTILDQQIIGLIGQMFYLSTLYNSLAGMFTQKVAFVFFAKNKNKKQKSKKGLLYINIFNLIVGIPVIIVFYFFPENLLLILWGDKWLKGADFLQSLALFTLLLPVVASIKSYIYGNAKNEIITISFLMATLFYFLLIILLDFEAVKYTIAYSISLPVVILFSIILMRLKALL